MEKKDEKTKVKVEKKDLKSVVKKSKRKGVSVVGGILAVLVGTLIIVFAFLTLFGTFFFLKYSTEESDEEVSLLVVTEDEKNLIDIVE
jgi:hypothetical protein